MQNINPETGIRYGIISAHSLDPDVIDAIQRYGKDLRLEDAMNEVEAGIRRICEDYMAPYDVQDIVDEARSRVEVDSDEPVHEFEIDDIKGRTTWLGGALLVWIFESPHTGVFQLCSPCVPGACNLDSPVDVLREKVGEIGYDVPPEWRCAQ